MDGGAVSKERLEELRRRKAVQARKRAMLQSLLSPGAYEKASNIRAANPELYEKIADLVIALAQRGSLTDKLSADQFQKLLARVNPRKETKITFKR